MATDTQLAPTDAEIAALRSEFGITSNGRGIKEFAQVCDFASAVLARWGQPAHSVEPVTKLSDEQIKAHGDKASRMMARDLTRFDAACEVNKYLLEQGTPYYYMHRMCIVLFGNDEGTEAARAPDTDPQPSPAAQEDALDAARWRALLACGRIRIIGTAGVTGTGAHDPKALDPNKQPYGNYVHFGAEFWSTFPDQDYYNTKENPAYARATLTEFADAARAAQEGK